MLRAVTNFVFFFVAAALMVALYRLVGYWALAAFVAFAYFCWWLYYLRTGHWPDEAPWAQPKD